MARKKKTIKAKEPIRLRFKSLSNGNKSIYLDIYKDGKRSYEFLKLYLIPNVDETSRIQNNNALQAANAIKAQRIIELTNSEAGITKSRTRSKMLLLDWMKHYGECKLKNGQSNSYHLTINNTIKHLVKYKGGSITLMDVDKDFCLGFIEYLKTAKRKDGKALLKSTSTIYFQCLNSALNEAVKEDVIPFNPITKINSDSKLKMPESTREFLTINELKLLIASECVQGEIKAAFLFSCFCGLRWSDVKGLKWNDIIKNGEQYQARLIMKKTNKPIYLPLSNEALRWMPNCSEAKDTENVFHLPSLTRISPALNVWAQGCGIAKHITFHTARHTFATMMLTLGADLYTTSNLLGHTQVKTTQVYAKIVDKKKAEAVNLANDVFGNL